LRGSRRKSKAALREKRFVQAGAGYKKAMNAQTLIKKRGHKKKEAYRRRSAPATNGSIETTLSSKTRKEEVLVGQQSSLGMGLVRRTRGNRKRILGGKKKTYGREEEADNERGDVVHAG